MKYEYLFYFYAFLFGIIGLLAVGEFIAMRFEKSKFTKWWRDKIIADGDKYSHWN
jgi:hypothetical protein